MILLLIITLLISCYIIKRKNHMSLFKKNGIPGPKPNLLFGNLFYKRKYSMLKRQKFLIEEYGKVVSYYSGNIGYVLVADTVLAKKILVENFHLFTDRWQVLFNDPLYNRLLPFSRGDEWRQIKSILSPTFSPANLKSFLPLIDESVERFLNILDKYSENGNELDILDHFQRLTAETIIKTSFGINSDVQTNHQNELYLTGEKVLQNTQIKYYLFLLCFIPEMKYVLKAIGKIIDFLKYDGDQSNVVIFRKTVEKMLKSNKIFSNERKNILKVLLESINTHHDEQKSYENRLILNKDEIVSNCSFFYGAGYETTSSVMAFTVHNIVNHQIVQDKIRQEIHNAHKEHGILDYDAISSLKYMEQVIDESMRMYPPVVKYVNRECSEDFKYENMTIPKGTTIVIPTYYLHHDPDNWQDPEKFDPDRFSPERKAKINSVSFQPFGIGPRNCIGIKYAYLVMKYTLAKLLLNYKLEIGPNTEIGRVTLKQNLFTISARNGINIKVVKQLDNDI